MMGPVLYSPSLPPLVPVEALALLGGEGGVPGGRLQAYLFPLRSRKLPRLRPAAMPPLAIGRLSPTG
jgi:hypothetical protein